MDAIEKRILEIIDEHKEELIAFGEDIYYHAEKGFCETRTAEKAAAFLKKLELSTEEGLAVTGVKARLFPSREEVQGPSVALIGELDGIRCDTHPHVNKENNMSHACGHNIQLTAILGAALALSDPTVKSTLSGQVLFMAVPAEEHVDMTVRDRLLAEGRLTFGFGGKSELIREGAFDDVDMVVTHHVHLAASDSDILVGSIPTNGFLSKRAIFKGKAAHAGAAPFDGINALNAASLGLSALAYQRETFKDSDHVRVHGIIHKGGSAVNVVPDEVVAEVMIRANSLEAIKDACMKTDRAFKAGAYALGAEVEINDFPGYFPVIASPAPSSLWEAAESIAGEKSFSTTPLNIQKADLTQHIAASTDVGDLSHLMPVLNFTTGGFTGALHSADYRIVDKEKAYLLPIKMMALSAYRLLKDGGRAALDEMASFKPVMTKTDYLNYLESFL